MAQQSSNRSRGKGRRRGNDRGYVHKSPAVCIVVHDPSGKPMPDSVAAQIVNTIHETAVNNGYLISFTRT